MNLRLHLAFQNTSSKDGDRTSLSLIQFWNPRRHPKGPWSGEIVEEVWKRGAQIASEREGDIDEVFCWNRAEYLQALAVLLLRAFASEQPDQHIERGTSGSIAARVYENVRPSKEADLLKKLFAVEAPEPKAPGEHGAPESGTLAPYFLGGKVKGPKGPASDLFSVHLTGLWRAAEFRVTFRGKPLGRASYLELAAHLERQLEGGTEGPYGPEAELELESWHPLRRERTGVTEPGLLPLRIPSPVWLNIRLKHPKYVYFVWIDAQGKTIPLYPWNPQSGVGVMPVVDRLPQACEANLEVPGGLETVVAVFSDRELNREVSNYLLEEAFLDLLVPEAVPSPEMSFPFRWEPQPSSEGGARSIVVGAAVIPPSGSNPVCEFQDQLGRRLAPVCAQAKAEYVGVSFWSRAEPEV